MTFKILVTGDRNWKAKGVVELAFRDVIDSIEAEVFNDWSLIDEIIVIEGGAKGADALCYTVAHDIRNGESPVSSDYIMRIKVNSILADWKSYGKAAGPIRNRLMLDQGPDYVIAFHDDLSLSKGTRNMVEQCVKAGLEVRLWSSDGHMRKIAKDT
jgi:hypothetical protein